MKTSRHVLTVVSSGPQSVESPNREASDNITEHDYLMLTAWRETLRHFMNVSKAILKQVNVTPNQYQALLAIRFGNQQEQLTVGELADKLHIRHNSSVTLVNQLVSRGMVRRVPSKRDRRVVHVQLSGKGETTLRKLVIAHRRELDAVAPTLRKLLP